ncbi:peptidase M23 [Bacteroidia bacterium]|nr:peptidase M23 [Bacteroidia bacterium]
MNKFMKKSYEYNSTILDFVQIRHSWLHYLYKGILALFVGLVFLSVFYIIFSFFFHTPEEKDLIKLDNVLSENYTEMSQRYKQLDKVIADLEQRDANIYRYIFETDPPKVDDYQNENLLKTIEEQSNETIILNAQKAIEKLQLTVNQQTNKLKDIVSTYQQQPHIHNIPTIQPIEDRDFRYIAATFGMRMHPFYKVLKMHTGIDFSAPLGANVYATASGKVVSVEKKYRNVGLSIVIDHTNGYKTHYYHLNEAKVKPNQKVDRGQIIGTVGNSGRSVAPHLHYEVWKDNKPYDPIHFFFGNIDPKDYHLLKIIVANKGQSMD